MILGAPSVEQAEKLFGRKASPDVNLSSKAFIQKKMSGITNKISGIKNKVIDGVSDAMSYSARRDAQKSMLQSDRKLEAVKSARDVRTRQAMQLNAIKASGPQISQRDSYAKAMSSAQRKGGSNGLGVGR